MPNQTIQVNYDELKTIAKHFNSEGEDITQLHSETRRRVRDMYKEWEGEAAEKFFDEMETELLPALERLAHALFFSQDVANKIMKIFNEGDTETASYFKGGLDGADDFGAGQFNAALGGISGGQSAPEDFGAGKFEEALPGQDGNQSAPGLGTEQAGSSQSGEAQQQGQASGTQSAGGGSGGGGSQGSQGDLKGLGESLGGQPQQTSSVGGSSGGGQNMPDHIYSGDSSGQSEGDSQQGATGGGSGGGDQTPAGGEGAVAAGAAGIAGTAAAGGAAKVLKDKKENDG